MSEQRQFTSEVVERLALRPEVLRGWRVAIALGGPLLVCHWLGRTTEAGFFAMAAQTLALPDLRGAYRVRLTILATMVIVAALSALLGAVAAGGLISSVLGMAAIALLAGVWRQVSADYGPAMAISSALLFLLGLSLPGGLTAGLHLAGAVVMGGAVATVLHMGLWLVRPQHPLRFAVAETWVAASDLAAAMRPEAPAMPDVATRERELRVLLDRTFLILDESKSPRQGALITHLEGMRREVVHFAMRLLAFNTALEPVARQPEFARALPMVDSVLKALSDCARSAAITLIMYRPENFAASELRLKRGQDLIHVLDEQLATSPENADLQQVRATLNHLAKELPRIRKALEETMGREIRKLRFRATLPDLSGRSIQSLAGWLNPEPHIDPVLVRYSARMAVLTMAAVAVYKGFHIPRGYWIAFTMVVVLQPDYGATRQRAGERMGGTLAGSLLASLLLWVQLPLVALDLLAAAMAFGFGYFLKERYGLAVFFVTMMIVLVTETTAPVQLDFTTERVISNVAGGLLALLAARLFWPNWEREKFSTLLAAGIRANRTYLESLLGAGGKDIPEPLMAKRRAENANRLIAASLERLLGEPAHLNAGAEYARALTTYNQRVTRALTVLAVHVPEDAKAEGEGIRETIRRIVSAQESLALAVEKEGAEGTLLRLGDTVENMEEALAHPDTNGDTQRLIWTQLVKTIGEIKAMALVVKGGTTQPVFGIAKGAAL